MTITAKIIQHSISPSGQQIVTWELEYQRFIHAEFLTHRLFSRNAASSRAIPVSAMIEQVRSNPAMPIHFGQNQSGMQAQNLLSKALTTSAKYVWKQAANSAAFFAEQLVKIGLHKQATNRILEPFQTMKTVMTATCMDNFFWLRNHPDAQPEIRELARLMWEALSESKPFELKPGEWHVPYVHRIRKHNYETSTDLEVQYWDVRDAKQLTLEQAIAISSSCCAQVSYRKLDDSLEKAEFVYKRLVESEPVHASPFEHQASPMKYATISPHALFVQKGWADGVTHVDKDGYWWSGNFIGWIQHRQLIPNNVCMNYKLEVANG